ncbi:Uncharacterised protein [Anaerotruncus sp. 2789STDY5834896]|uniref:Uncharacterized protein n=1 Tax=uncultured Anaerotruncus sp. TaxID=905011 RepID=A0A1C6J4P4_9FIRM|nr:Uncharacterised protein [uncultured Anaerotruncus sp.]
MPTIPTAKVAIMGMVRSFAPNSRRPAPAVRQRLAASETKYTSSSTTTRKPAPLMLLIACSLTVSSSQASTAPPPMITESRYSRLAVIKFLNFCTISPPLDSATAGIAVYRRRRFTGISIAYICRCCL